MTDEFRPEKKKKRKKRKLARGVLALVAAAVLAYAVMAFITGGTDLARISSVFAGRRPLETADVFYFYVGRQRSFADIEDGIATAGTLGIQVLDYSGAETLRVSYRMSAPAISSAGGRAIAYDIGGTEVRVFDRAEVIASFETPHAITSASINQNGWFCVVTMPETGGHRGVVTVYDARGRDVFRAFSGGYALAAVLAPDNRNMAVLTLTDTGSAITFWNLGNERAGNSFELPGGLILDIRYISGGNILAFTMDSLIVVDRNGNGTELYNFEGRRLGGYSQDGNLIALHLLDYGVGHSGRLVTLDTRGRLLGEMNVSREIISISVGDGHLSVLWGDGPRLYDSALDEIPISGQLTALVGLGRVITLARGTILAAGDHSAVIFRPD